MVSSSQKESSRNAVEECPGRVDTLGRSSLHDEKFIQQKISQKGVSYEKFGKASGRVIQPSRFPYRGTGSFSIVMRGLFRVQQLKLSVFGATRSKALLLMLVSAATSVRATGYMTEDAAMKFMKKIPGLVDQAARKDPRLGGAVAFKMEHLRSDMVCQPETTFLDLDGFYTTRNQKPLSRFQTQQCNGHRMKWNFKLPGNKGFSPMYFKNDVQVYSGNEQCAVFTALQQQHLYILVPFRTDATSHVNLCVFSTKSYLENPQEEWKYQWNYLRLAGSPRGHPLFGPVTQNMESCWTHNEAGVDFEDISGYQAHDGRSQYNYGHTEPGPERHGGAHHEVNTQNHDKRCYGQSSAAPRGPPRDPGRPANWRKTGEGNMEAIARASMRKALEKQWSKQSKKGWVHENCPKGIFAFNKSKGYVWHPHEWSLESVLEQNADAVRASLTAVGSVCRGCKESMPRKCAQTTTRMKKGTFGYRTRMSS